MAVISLLAATHFLGTPFFDKLSTFAGTAAILEIAFHIAISTEKTKVLAQHTLPAMSLHDL